MGVLRSFLWSPANDINGTFCGSVADGIAYTSKDTNYIFRDSHGYVIPRAGITSINGLNASVSDCDWKTVQVFGPYSNQPDACASIANRQTILLTEITQIGYVMPMSGEVRPGTGLPGDEMWFDGKDFYATKERPVGNTNDFPWPAGHYIIWPRNGVDAGGDMWQYAQFNGIGQFPVTIGVQGQGC